MKNLKNKNETVIFVFKLILLLVFGLGFASILESQSTELKLYPNPTKGMFFLSTKKKFKIRVYDIKGKHLTDFPDLRCFPSGIYLVNISINNKEINKKIIKI
jgi:hypothetical protein